eukprot:GHVR01127345.1.p1 GENE.GHVR01127345.1~~GHVR01127345.1.p1  ORF type:complete len:111 (-),score=0.66 GHVR01127345.1:1004-1336(-)
MIRLHFFRDNPPNLYYDTLTVAIKTFLLDAKQPLYMMLGLGQVRQQFLLAWLNFHLRNQHHILHLEFFYFLKAKDNLYALVCPYLFLGNQVYGSYTGKVYAWGYEDPTNS